MQQSSKKRNSTDPDAESIFSTMRVNKQCRLTGDASHTAVTPAGAVLPTMQCSCDSVFCGSVPYIYLAPLTDADSFHCKSLCADSFESLCYAVDNGSQTAVLPDLQCVSRWATWQQCLENCLWGLAETGNAVQVQHSTPQKLQLYA